ncbi:hypothetical protein SAMN06298216_3881 [Spirosomataceae bacterium TFI 002]|nr:hypothetical protein SAMN06298216_3881 [Spirosomataceae bacterium TFI 002]
MKISRKLYYLLSFALAFTLFKGVEHFVETDNVTCQVSKSDSSKNHHFSLSLNEGEVDESEEEDSDHFDILFQLTLDFQSLSFEPFFTAIGSLKSSNHFLFGEICKSPLYLVFENFRL